MQETINFLGITGQKTRRKSLYSIPNTHRSTPNAPKYHKYPFSKVFEFTWFADVYDPEKGIDGKETGNKQFVHGTSRYRTMLQQNGDWSHDTLTKWVQVEVGRKNRIKIEVDMPVHPVPFRMIFNTFQAASSVTHWHSEPVIYDSGSTLIERRVDALERWARSHGFEG